MTDFRDLCKELVDELSVWTGYGDPEADFDGVHALIDRARAALAEQPVGPTDEEIMEMMPQQMCDDLAAAARALARFHQGRDLKTRSVHRIILNRHAVDHARAVLAKWGGPTLARDRPEGPTDEELLSMRSWSSQFRTFDSDLVDYARAVLARWGAPAATPLADGEVERLQWIADEFAQGSELKGSGYASDIQAVIKHILHSQPRDQQ